MRRTSRVSVAPIDAFGLALRGFYGDAPWAL